MLEVLLLSYLMFQRMSRLHRVERVRRWGYFGHERVNLNK